MKRYSIALASFALWLAAWIALSWPGIQDDALIHLRYADHLRMFHRITYDGVHPNFGTSSLLYVSLLAMASAWTRSPELARFVSSLFHVLLVGGLASLFWRRVARTSGVAALLSLVLLALLISPASIRWLDDGMETGLVLCATSCLAWLTFDESRRPATSGVRFLLLAVLGYLLVLLRSELGMLNGMAFLAIVAGRTQKSGQWTPRGVLRTAIEASHLLIGSAIACATILISMGVLLPDTAIAKAEGLGAWKLVLIATGGVLISSFAVGAGLAVFWLMTLLFVFLRRRNDAATTVVNLVFPVLLCLTMVRGQAVQGVRYMLWAILFPALWNLLTLAAAGESSVSETRRERRMLYAFIALLLVELPIESRMMFGVLTTRAKTIREFEGQHLEQLAGLHGVSMDIGYIGYFTGAQICDMSGLVNGREVARLAPQPRVRRCAEEHPEFAFGNPGQLEGLAKYLDINGWRVCSAYDFGNVRTADTHYLVAPSETSDRICRAAGTPGGPDAAIGTILHGTSSTPSVEQQPSR